MKQYLARNGLPSEYNKAIGIKEEKLRLIEKIKGKKSRAGKLDEMIDYYVKSKKIKICEK